MDSEQLWERVKEVYRLNTESNEPYFFNDVIAILFSETDKTLILQAKDASEALYLNVQFADPLIAALESIIGSPAFIECVYSSKVPKPNSQFIVRRMNEDCIINN